ncbi:MAG: tRNA pseudouridine(38-40) synthase TruA [Planctomycetaceae bacterium]|nr:tRNA pseudouridine(38-40) synthase TruA [Planctomycetaceae bacterium]
MKRFRFNVSYDGGNYAGWQTQPNLPTVQKTLENVLLRITGQRIHITGSGRTDAGVHALCQTAAFSTDSSLDAEVFTRAMNGFLPPDIRILEMKEVPLNFNPIRDAVSKRYRYVIDDNRPHCPFIRNYSWTYRKKLDVEAMQAAAEYLKGEHDFTCFQSLNSPRKTTVRTILDAVVKRKELSSEFVFPAPPLIFIEVEATGFLYNMMRAIAGTLVLFGTSKRDGEGNYNFLPPEQMREIIESRERGRAGAVAPPQGLFLQYAVYPPE